MNKLANCSVDEVTGAIEAEKLFKSGFRNVNLILFAVALPILRVPHRLSSHVNFNCNKWLVVATIAAVLSALSCQLDLSLSLSVSWCSSAGAVQFHGSGVYSNVLTTKASKAKNRFHGIYMDIYLDRDSLLFAINPSTFHFIKSTLRCI